jgi:hypothetical protein
MPMTPGRETNPHHGVRGMTDERDEMNERDERNWRVMLEYDRPRWTIGSVCVASGLPRREAEQLAARYNRDSSQGHFRAIAVPDEEERRACR